MLVLNRPKPVLAKYVGNFLSHVSSFALRSVLLAIHYIASPQHEPRVQASQSRKEGRNDGPVCLFPLSPRLVRATQCEIPQLVLVDGEGLELTTVAILKFEILAPVKRNEKSRMGGKTETIGEPQGRYLEAQL